jgi:hypothetical protein
MDDCLVHSPTLEQHLLYVAEVLETFRRHQLYAKSSKCEFGRRELGFLGHRLSKEGVSVDPRKVQSIVEWATPTSCMEVLRFTVTDLADYHRRSWPRSRRRPGPPLRTKWSRCCSVRARQ